MNDVEPELPQKIYKYSKLSWDGRQLMVRIPLKITRGMGINKNNKGNFRVEFDFIESGMDVDIKIIAKNKRK